ncbi:hypothetical protein J4E83_006937 [Alternaria metachromatica]|uniref:uncharacterized protein n=1 Tax=Alternaria metachromatica TaxID=283354 RepID=UPI0020C5A9EF|nr:uncharacterized protein J4E83_006937 [Alternaria metachromatica]KAI4615211.1 hypothetical protein J4E83_006937 [Alternaria metachromatica]
MARVIQQDKDQKYRITPLVAQLVSDLAICFELRARLRLVCPQAFKPDEQYCTVGADRDYHEIVMEVSVKELNVILDPECGPEYDAKRRYDFLLLGELGHPKTMPYPVGKRRTKENVEIMQATERRLDELWSKFDAHVQKYLKKIHLEALESLAPSRGQIQRTPDWIEPAKPSNKAKKDAALQEYITPLIPEQQPDPVDLPIRSEKRKTRGIANDPSTEPVEVAADLQPVASEETNTPPTPRFTVGKKTQHTFSTIFFQPSASSHPGEVPWTEFLSAMNTIGFSPEKVYGSVWRFTPREGGVITVKQPINFHEPHPEGKLRFEVARNYGRRLTRNYGIDGSSFVIA